MWLRYFSSGKRTELLLCGISSITIMYCSLTNAAERPIFSDDVALLNKHFSPVVLKLNGDQTLVLLSELQGRVMTGSQSGYHGESIGWFNRAKLEETSALANHESRISAGIDGSIGGAERTWFGPDGGTYSLFFDKHAARLPDNIRPPAAVNVTPYQLTYRTDSSATFEQTVSFNNHIGFDFVAKVERSVRIIAQNEVEALIGINLPKSVRRLTYTSQTKVTNLNESSWNADTGLFSIWSLAMLAPDAIAVIPLKRPIKERATSYFSSTSVSRQKVTDKAVFYLADANRMDKIGVPVVNSTAWVGSYHPKRQLLTLTKLNPHPDPNSSYVSAVWADDAPALDGESHNIFNDGPQQNGKPFGPFFELESSSPALKLKPNEAHIHNYSVLHFSGPISELTKISESVIKLSIEELIQTYNELSKQNQQDTP